MLWVLLPIEVRNVATIFYSSLISFAITYSSKRSQYAFQSSELGLYNPIIRVAILVASCCVLGFVVYYHRVTRAQTKCFTQLLY